MYGKFKQMTALGLAGVMTVTAGCGGGRMALDRDDLDRPVTATTYEVVTHDGRSLTFISLHMEGDTLVGTRRVTETQTVGEGDARRDQVTNRYEETRVPWSDVDRVEAVGVNKRSSGVLLVGGAIALGVTAFLLLSSGKDDTPTDGGGKGF
jgi:hypothetical protein